MEILLAWDVAVVVGAALSLGNSPLSPLSAVYRRWLVGSGICSSELRVGKGLRLVGVGRVTRMDAESNEEHAPAW